MFCRRHRIAATPQIGRAHRVRRLKTCLMLMAGAHAELERRVCPGVAFVARVFVGGADVLMDFPRVRGRLTDWPSLDVGALRRAVILALHVQQRSVTVFALSQCQNRCQVHWGSALGKCGSYSPFGSALKWVSGRGSCCGRCRVFLGSMCPMRLVRVQGHVCVHERVRAQMRPQLSPHNRLLTPLSYLTTLYSTIHST